MPESQATQKFIEIDSIENDVVALKGGGLRKVILVSGVNMELKSEEEQNAVYYSYQNLLNSLDFPLQFVVHSRKLNIDPYLALLESYRGKETNELLRSQIVEYKEFIKSFVQQNEIMTKTFFVVVPYDPIVVAGSEGLAKFIPFLKKTTPSAQTQKGEARQKNLTQLNQRVDQVISNLGQIGLRSVVLNKEELIELFYNLYNPESIEKKDLAIAKQ